MIRAVGFDLDDTILDHRGAASTAIGLVLQQHGWVYEGAIEIGSEWERIEKIHFAAFLAGKLTMAGQRRERMRDFLALAQVRLPDVELDDLFLEYLAYYAKSWVPFPDVLPTLTSLQDSGFRLAVLTNGLQEQQEAKLASMGFLHMFESVLALGTLTELKPHPQAFLELSSALKCDPAEIVFVGDDPHVDAIGASAAGLHGVWLNREGRVPPDGVGAQVDSLALLASAVLDWPRSG